MSVIETNIEIPADYSVSVFGQFDEYVKKIEKTLKVTIIARDSQVKILGSESGVGHARKVLANLLELAKRGNTITEQNVDYALALCMDEKEDAVLEIDDELVCRTITGKPIKPKTLGQKYYVEQIRQKMIVFGLGPAGTGKTYLAMAMAIQAFKNNEVGRITRISSGRSAEQSRSVSAPFIRCPVSDYGCGVISEKYGKRSD